MIKLEELAQRVKDRKAKEEEVLLNESSIYYGSNMTENFILVGFKDEDEVVKVIVQQLIELDKKFKYFEETNRYLRRTVNELESRLALIEEALIELTGNDTEE